MVNINRERGFTLIELLVVIAIIGVLATLLLLQLGGARAKARDAKRVSDITQIRTAIEQYFDDNAGTYPQISLYTTDPLSPYLGAGRMAATTDPLDQAQYGYSTAPLVSGKVLRYQVWAEMESGNPGIKTDDDITTTGWTARNTGRMGVLTNGPDPVAGTCIDNDLTNGNCVFDVGIR
ncbi:MAG: N-terminal methylation motif domain-containing protein [Parcubacteria group bacterium Gr01-1014_2]|nr:MAG: N-terminal methylation motif domain-containing protein [Parcubacteria group bacterium Gr01-1014_2]